MKIMVVRHDGKEGSKIKIEGEDGGDVEQLTLHLNSNYEQCVEAQRRQIYFLTKTKTGLFCTTPTAGSKPCVEGSVLTTQVPLVDSF